jgi:hypothetical protein
MLYKVGWVVGLGNWGGDGNLPFCRLKVMVHHCDTRE